MTNDAVFARFPRPVPPAAEGKATAPFFGGDQEWLARYTARLAGCGPVAVANAFATFAAADFHIADAVELHPAPDGTVPLAVYTAFMERVYADVRTRQISALCDIVDGRRARAAELLASASADDRKRGRAQMHSPLAHLPATFGNSAHSLQNGVRRYAAGRGLRLLWREKKTHGLPYNEGLAFIEEALQAGAPPILLTHLNRFDIYHHAGDFVNDPPKGGGQAMHFTCITDIRNGRDDPGPELVVADSGRLLTVPYAGLHRSWQGVRTLGGALFWFTPAAVAAPQAFQPSPLPAQGAVGAIQAARR